jgi:hypothetical protein
MKNKIFLTAAASLLALSLSTGASAAPMPMIDGELHYSSVSGPTGAWDFDLVNQTVTIGAGEVDTVSGDFSGIPTGTALASVSTFIYDPFVPTQTIWSVGGFTFNLNSVTATPIGGLLVLTGMGTVSSVGFTDTTMAWTIAGGQNSSFSASTVPEPSVIALFGLGLLGLGLARRKIRS